MLNAEQGGLPGGAWRSSGLIVQTYQAVRFIEEEPPSWTN